MTGDLVDRAVRIVNHNTSGPQPERCPWHAVVSILTGDPALDASANDVWDALEQAVADGRLRTDEDGEEFWLPE